MKKSNSGLRQNTVLTDEKGNFIEFIGSKESRMRALSQIFGAYCRQIKSEIAVNR